MLVDLDAARRSAPGDVAEHQHAVAVGPQDLLRLRRKAPSSSSAASRYAFTPSRPKKTVFSGAPRTGFISA